MSTSGRKSRFKANLVNSFLLIALAAGLYLLISGGWNYYNHLQDLEKYKKEVTVATRQDATPEEKQAAEGKDEQQPDPLDGHRVEPSHPRAIYIDKIGVKARVLPMNLNPDRSIQAPINIFDTGWYVGSSKPGEPGVSLISGHASGPSRQGLFAYLDTLVAGDKLTVERGDGSKLTYTVEAKKEFPLEQVDMNDILTARDDAERLNLITCSGEWLKDMTTFNKRTVVYTKRSA